jgi:drug/metabolite transporter (DMT)-like permease
LNNQSSINAWAAYLAVAIFWGTTFLAIRIGVQSMPPFLMAGMRHFTAGILICSYFLLRGYTLPTWAQLKVCIIQGVLLLVLGNGLVSWAELYITSGLTALICALSPLMIIGANTLMGKKELFFYLLQLLVGVLVQFILSITLQVCIRYMQPVFKC